MAACDSTDDDVLIDADDEHLGGVDTSRRLKSGKQGASPRSVRHTDTATAMLCGSGRALLSPDGQGNAGAQLTSGEAFLSSLRFGGLVSLVKIQMSTVLTQPPCLSCVCLAGLSLRVGGNQIVAEGVVP